MYCLIFLPFVVGYDMQLQFMKMLHSIKPIKQLLHNPSGYLHLS